MIKNHNNVAGIIIQAIEANNPKNLIKSKTGQYIHWNQELRLSDMDNNLKRNSEFFNRENSKRKSDVWYYTKVKKGSTTEQNLNIAGVTFPWNDANINPDKFDNDSDTSYIHPPFDSKYVQINALAEARKTKIDKYDPIVNVAKTWLQEKIEEIRIKYKVSNVNVNCKFIVTSNLGIVREETKREMCSLIDSDKKERLRYGRMKRMINQAIRESF
jgi:hypothetical protein